MNKQNKTPLFTRKALATAITSMYLGCTLAPIYASDTEIYTQVVTSTANAPTVMMVLDTSGSMQWCMDQTSSSYSNKNGCTNPDNSRISVLKSAVRTVLKGDLTANPIIAPAPGFVKMGYARFNPDANKGGWVRYPARPLDALVEIAPDGTINEYGLDTKSDTVQTSSTPNGINTATLTIGQGSTVGLSFNDVMIPKGAVITEAYIELTASNDDSSAGNWLVSVEDSVSPTDYTSVGVDSRTYASTNAEYTPTSWVAGQRYQIPVNDLVSYIAQKSSWCGGSRINFKIANKEAGSTVQRRAYSFDSSANKPTLFVRYSVNPAATNSCIKVDRSSTFTPVNSNDDGDYFEGSTSLDMADTALYPNYVEVTTSRRTTTYTKLFTILRIPNVLVGNNAQITSAKLIGQSTSNQSITSVQPMKVEMFDTGNVASFCPSTCSIPSYSTKIRAANWTGPVPKDAYSEIDVTSMVQEVVNRSDWSSNNAMGFRFSNTTNTSDNPTFYSRDGSTSKSMALSVTWKETVTDLSKLTTVRDDILNDLNLTVEGGTPLGAAYAEASRYMLGLVPYVRNGTADFGTGASAVSYPVHDPRTLNEARTQFVSPVDTEGCSGNYIFMMSDGEPNDLANVNSNTQGITGGTCDRGLDVTVSGNGKSLNWYCMYDLAAHNLKSNNQIGASIHTSTVYFGPNTSTDTRMQATINDNIANMKTVADKGDGDAFQATDKAKLVEALSKTVQKAVEGGGTIAAPGVAVNQLNRLNHLDQLYYAVFDPSPLKYTWNGNLKRYKLQADGSAIVDSSIPAKEAIDPTTGFFKKNTKSFWSATEDGDQTLEGGAASKLTTPATRKMYTYLGSLASKNQPLREIDLADSTFNSEAMSAMGITSNTIYTNLMNWYKGYTIPSLTSTSITIDANTPVRKRMGGALHSQPVLVNYGYNGALSTSDDPDNQKNYIFMSTLEGALHVVEAKTGVEKFSFIPGEKLADLKTRYENPTSVNPGFGVDLTWTFIRQDINKDGQIGSSDKLYIYGGMRMGGSNYYALDVSNLNSPNLLFAIKGGEAGTAFAKMGQTWSQPVVTTMRVANVLKQVLVFGGGYDPVHETANVINNGTNNLGNLIYIVDAVTGQLIWYASGNSTDSGAFSVPDMKFSVPTTPNVVDINGDGLADSIYFGDLGGQLFRVDVNNFADNANNLVKRVKLVAKLGETATATTTNQRRFYEAPAVAMFYDTEGKQFATVAQGSGYRSHPLDRTIDENFFVVFDYDLPRADLLAADSASLQSVVTKSDLAALDLNSTAVQTSGVTLTTGQKGWYVDLPGSGEKSLAEPLIFKKKLLFTTYLPDSSSAAKCTPVVGRTKMYTFCMPYGKLCSTTSSYAKDNVMIGLAGEPQLMIIPDPANPGKYKTVIITGTAVDNTTFSDVDVSPKLETLNRWREKIKKTTPNETGQ